jgi:hypothetical protein
VHHQLALHGFWLVVWLLKVYKILRKSLKEFGLNLKRKVCFKKSLKKKRKKEKLTFSPFGPAWPAGPPNLPAAAHPTALLFFFLADTDTWAPPVSLSPSPSFLLPHLGASRPGATARIPPRPATSLPSLLTKPAN